MNNVKYSFIVNVALYNVFVVDRAGLADADRFFPFLVDRLQPLLFFLS